MRISKFGWSIACLVLVSSCGSPPDPADEMPPPPLPMPFEVAVDTELTPHATVLAPFEDGVPRPLATLTDESGKQTDFVENELIVEFARPEDLDIFLAKWRGTVLAIDEPRTVGIDAEPTYLIRVQTESADLARLNDDLSDLSSGGGAPISVSTEAARQLIAAGAETARKGRRVGINYLTESTGFQDENVAEAPSSPNKMYDDYGYVVESWSANPFQWVNMKRGGPFDIGVAAAWSLLDRVGALDHKVKIAVIDGGFGLGDDFPSPFESNSASVAAHDPTGPNEVLCSGGSACPWHGWNVVNAATGQVDNGVGAAGPAGPVGKVLAIRRTADVFNNIQAITIALFSGANIINMSFGARVPASLAWSVIPFDLATLRAHGAGKLLFAAAGNDAEDINEEDCLLGAVCWESAWVTPCENGGVICVGAMDARAPNRRLTSNYGGDELDIWGPGAVWVGGDLADGSPHAFTATSAASPFVAGVAALIWAANPGLDNAGVEQVMYETAHHGGPREVERWPNAYEAVIRALGGTPPAISIDVESVQIFGGCEPLYRFTATVTDPDQGTHTVKWTSDIDGALGTGNSLTRPLSDGTHHITAVAIDSIGLTSRSNELVLRVGKASAPSAPAPTIEIISLVNHQAFAANQDVTFEAAGLDPAGRLVPSNMRWVSSIDGELGAGQRLVRTLSPGSHYITVYYTGTCGGTADDQRLIEITAAVADAPPNMLITTPVTNDIVLYADASGQGCLMVAGFGFDEEDQDFATIEWWETNRSDLQWKVLSFEQNTTVCVKISESVTATTHEIRLLGVDRTGHRAYSAPLRVTVAPGLR